MFEMARLQQCPSFLDFNGFREHQRIFQIDGWIPDSAIHFGVPKQERHGAQIARFRVDLCDFGPAHQMSATSHGPKTLRNLLDASNSTLDLGFSLCHRAPR